MTLGCINSVNNYSQITQLNHFHSAQQIYQHVHWNLKLVCVEVSFKDITLIDGPENVKRLCTVDAAVMEIILKPKSNVCKNVDNTIEINLHKSDFIVVRLFYLVLIFVIEMVFKYKTEKKSDLHFYQYDNKMYIHTYSINVILFYYFCESLRCVSNFGKQELCFSKFPNVQICSDDKATPPVYSCTIFYPNVHISISAINCIILNIYIRTNCCMSLTFNLFIVSFS